MRGWSKAVKVFVWFLVNYLFLFFLATGSSSWLATNCVRNSKARRIGSGSTGGMGCGWVMALPPPAAAGPERCRTPTALAARSPALRTNLHVYPQYYTGVVVIRVRTSLTAGTCESR